MTFWEKYIQRQRKAWLWLSDEEYEELIEWQRHFMSTPFSAQPSGLLMAALVDKIESQEKQIKELEDRV